jgi:transcriptional regulator with XRE-family HTH domain
MLVRMANYPGTEATTRRELGDFLKSRRARIHPETVGLSNGTRRRTPGLRREEVAQLAGVGLTWYTWLEQGRDIRVSQLVLQAIARTLQLEPTERRHLHRLAGYEAPSEASCAREAVGATLRRVLELWEPYPAQVTGRRIDVLAWNRAAAAVFGDLSLQPEGRRNNVWRIFMQRECRELLVDWEDEAARLVASLRAEAGPDLADPDYQDLIAELLEQSAEFGALWARQDVRGRLEGLKRLRHPVVGRLDLTHTTYRVNDHPNLQLVLYTAAKDSETDLKLRRLAGRP